MPLSPCTSGRFVFFASAQSKVHQCALTHIERRCELLAAGAGVTLSGLDGDEGAGTSDERNELGSMEELRKRVLGPLDWAGIRTWGRRMLTG